METRDLIVALMPKYCSYRKLARDISRHNRISHAMIAKIYHHRVENVGHHTHLAIEKVYRQHFGN